MTLQSKASPLAHLNFQRLKPHPALRELVQCYWHIQVNDNHHSSESTSKIQTDYFHPEGGSGIIFNFSNSIKVNNQLVSNDVFISGPTLITHNLQTTNDINTLGIRFYPGSASTFYSQPLSELVEQLLQPDELSIKGIGKDLYEQLAESKSLQKRINLLDHTLLSILKNSQPVSLRVRTAVRHINSSRGKIEIASLSELLNLSQRQLDRDFKHHLGLVPKQYSMIKRLEFARNLIKNNPCNMNLTEIALESGFYDQAHFTRQFKQVIGITPSLYQKKSKCMAESTIK
ncbi:AraC family transcriptional regulator [Aliikangiella sp. G2MR2-5]|uniref:helix-turn-helix domain-containing protein n=1 Tax=Aliikangiella sp. G2MR2-5 TaxID=2788943 RepID=UPI0018AB50FC|nr:AraC family transcriptional regulator [Aliikangiella sp. G2MR2-5]